MEQLSYESQYLNILERIITEGEVKSNRTGVDTLVIPPTTITHDFATGTFPMLTTKEMAMNAMARENQGFIGGITDKEWYRSNKCHIWNEWARQDIINQYDYTSPDCMAAFANDHNIDLRDMTDRLVKVAKKYPKKEDKDHKRMTCQYLLQDLGPIYGYQWRRFGKEYEGIISEPIPPAKDLAEAHELGDQFSHMIHMLKSNPDDRRMKVEAWNFNHVKQQALPACHTDFTIQHINGTLHLTWQQRSCDFFYGIPFNLGNYALLLLLICKETGMKPGTVTGFLVDVHVYVDQIPDIKIQLERELFPAPAIPNIVNWTSIFDWSSDDMVWSESYKCHGPLRTAAVAV